MDAKTCLGFIMILALAFGIFAVPGGWPTDQGSEGSRSLRPGRLYPFWMIPPVWRPATGPNTGPGAPNYYAQSF